MCVEKESDREEGVSGFIRDMKEEHLAVELQQKVEADLKSWLEAV